MDWTSTYSVIVIFVHLGLLAVGVWLTVVDARTHLLPNRIVLPTGLVVLVLVAVDAVVTASADAAVRAFVGMLALGGIYLLLRLISGGVMGGGDVKLAAVIGLVLGWNSWQALVVGGASAFVLAALYSLALIATKRATRRTRIAFGPWMVLGAVVGVLLR